MMHRASARPCSGLRPLVAAPVERVGWREHLRQAIADCGHTQESFGEALAMPRQHVARLFDPSTRRPLTAELLERMRDSSDTRAVWRRFMDLHGATAEQQQAVG